MVVMNQMNRFHLAAEAIRRIPRLRNRAPTLRAECDAPDRRGHRVRP
jgi:xylulose-5-phosphate/fructose-6-phosphate phosphoketolase